MIPKSFSIYENVRFVVKSPTLGKRKPNFDICLIIINYKSKHRAFRKGNRKVPQKLFHTHYSLGGHRGIENWDFVIFGRCETHVQLKEGQTFWQHRLYPIHLNETKWKNEKEEYLYWYFGIKLFRIFFQDFCLIQT